MLLLSDRAYVQFSRRAQHKYPFCILGPLGRVDDLAAQLVHHLPILD